MGIYFGNHFGREPFQFDSVGNHWEQESVARPDGYPQYLSRLFVRYFNCSVYEYLTAYRINRAKELLIMEHDRKVQEIAHDVGYTDASHFIVMFKKLTGMTPVELRKLHV